MAQLSPPIVYPEYFKGIAIFSPGGDVIYCIDPSKYSHWHLQLCTALQEILSLPEPPHFLVPAYTATMDRWFDSYSGQPKTVAQVYPAVKKEQPLLNAIFGTKDLVWNIAPWQEASCNPLMIETYRHQFPQLWENHDLIIRFEGTNNLSALKNDLAIQMPLFSPVAQTPQGYILRLFVSGNTRATKQTLKIIHQLLEQELRHPYTLKVIDIAQHPEQAETNQISAIPTLVRVWPQPVRRIVGEIDDISKVLQILEHPP